MTFNILKPWLTLDDWQKKYIETEGNCFLLCGRQSGKSAAASIKFGKRAATKPNRMILMIALTEKQAYSLFDKTLVYLEQCYPQMIKYGKDKPTKHEISLKNGSVIMCYAAGMQGDGLRGFTLTDLVVDEAAPMDRGVFSSVMPMLSVTGGSIDIMSTPRGKDNFFYECSLNENFTKFYISSEDCPRHDKNFLESEKKRMSKLEYAQEYLAIFLDELQRLFNDDLLKKCCIIKRKELEKQKKYYLGCDIAGLGKDETTYEVIEKINNDNFEQRENIIEKRNYTTDTSQKILTLEEVYGFKEIGVDDAGAGFGVWCELLLNDKTKRKVRALNNATRPLNKDGNKNKKLLKEEMYLNLLAGMEQGKVKLLDDDELIQSLKSVQFEYNVSEGRNTDLRIFGNYTHICEGICRAFWLASQDKSLNIWVYY